MDNRLELIKTLVPQGSRVADIGADHGRLVVELVLSGRATGGFACDINRQPLEKSIKAIREAGLQQQITPLLCDGLAGLSPQDVDCIVIAGMGGELISDILERSPEFRSRPELVYLLQPMTKADKLREYLFMNGYDFATEECVTEGRFTYSVIMVRYTGMPHTPTLRERLFGGVTRFDTPDRVLYAKRVLNRLNKKIQGLHQSGGNAPELEKLAVSIKQQLKEDSVCDGTETNL